MRGSFPIDLTAGPRPPLAPHGANEACERDSPLQQIGDPPRADVEAELDGDLGVSGQMPDQPGDLANGAVAGSADERQVQMPSGSYRVSS
jgi:hypothetical protein